MECVKRLNGDLTTYCNTGFSTEDGKDYADQIKNSITCFYDGVFISAIARWRLLTLAYDVYTTFGIKSVYCDTDSHKFMNPTPDLIEYINNLNVTIERDNKKNIEHFIEYNECYTDLGTWDIEFYPMSMYDPDSNREYIAKFKTLGAKRYIIDLVSKGEHRMQQTVAGLPKGEMLRQYETIENCFDSFADEMTITGCKLLAHYVDDPYTITVTDEQGNTDTHTELSCCALLPNNFSMTIDKLWKAWYSEFAFERHGDNREQRLI